MQIVDGHVHLQFNDDLRLVEQTHDLQAYRTAIAGTGIHWFAVLVMAPESDLAGTRRLNDAALALQQSEPAAFALCSVHPRDGEAALAELRRVAEAGAAGVKLHPNTQAFDLDEPGVADVVRTAGEIGLPVLFDSVSVTDPGQPEKFVRLAVECQDTNLVLAHTFGPKFAQAVMFKVLTANPWVRRNVYLELSAITSMFAGSPYCEQLAWICRNHGLDRVLWGSDYPLYSPATALEALDALSFSAGERRAVLADTATQLYNLTES